MMENYIIKVSLQEQSIIHGFLCKQLVELENSQKYENYLCGKLEDTEEINRLHESMKLRENAIREFEALRKKVALAEIETV